jgi:hypothetical protein
MLTQNELIRLFQQNQQDPHTLEPKRAPSVQSERKRKHASIEDVFHLNEIAHLIDEVLHDSEALAAADSVHGLSIRYLVTKDRRCLIAKEGRPDIGTPGHGQMATSCIAAGNLFINRDNHQIKAVNHQSGDFQPGPETLVFILQALLATPELEISPELYMIIEQFIPGIDSQTMIFSQEFRALVENLPGQEQQQEQENDDAIEAGYRTP